MNRTMSFISGILLLGACQKAQDEAPPPSNQAAPIAPAPSSNELGSAPAPAPKPPEPGTPGGLPDDRTPLAESRGSIGPKSPEAAGQVVQHYGALIEQNRFAEAEALWGDAAAAKPETAELQTYSERHLQVGKPHDMEGAAGSSYINVPIVLYGTRAGKAAHRSGEVVLRRVNDVPGSTEAQRRWHIERIDWKA